MLSVLLYLWLTWAMGNLVLLLLAPYWAKSPGAAYTNGIVIVVPLWFSEMLSAEEIEAIIAHENGHRAKLHAWRNLARICCFVRRSRAVFERQELEADDYAAERCDPLSLASALRRLSFDPFDLYRAQRLEGMGHAGGRRWLRLFVS